ncbi:hypothetical protein F4808DRAFT_57416 [Astrocystis sublimbata]|nr:hypothetical protein F4808DRAFT_57416 [Astrocystis sublimbata]
MMAPQCRGFSHPLVLLVRSTLRTTPSLDAAPSRRTTSLLRPFTQPSLQPRSFSSCRTLCAAMKMALPPRAKPRAKPTTGLVSDKIKTLQDLGYAQRLTLKGKPTTLYEAAPQLSFLISSYGAGLFCFGAAAINSTLNVFHLPPDISPWVPVGFGVISFMFAIIGTVFCMKPTGIIRSIKLLPRNPSSQTPGPSPLMLEVVARSTIPLPLPAKSMQIEPERLVMVNRMQQRPIALSRVEREAKKVQDARRRKEEREYELEHLMTAPFRDAGRASSSLMGNIRRGLTGEGFAPVYINGVRYKLDIEGGYALEDGQALDRIVRIQPDLAMAQVQSQKA